MAGACMRWPRQNFDEMVGFYGPVGENQTTLVLPQAYPMVLAWDTAKRITRFSCHEKVKEPAFRALTRALEHYGSDGIVALRLHLFGGCLNVRKMRNGTAWSVHSWGAAFDFDPERNRLQWGRERAAFAQPEYDRWWEFWEAEGFVSLGRARDFDWMHVQAARL